MNEKLLFISSFIIMYYIGTWLFGRDDIGFILIYGYFTGIVCHIVLGVYHGFQEVDKEEGV